jgi:hypothetical protein
MTRNERCFQDFVKRNQDDLMREWNHYRFNPNVDYCPCSGEGGCAHAHTFEAYARKEFEAYTCQIQDDKAAEVYAWMTSKAVRS